MTGVVEFVGVKAAALHTAPLPEKKRLIECIGDSIMCGAHTERGNPFPDTCDDEYRGNRESSHLSWCPTMARALGAEYQMECCSGNGLVSTDNPLSVSHCNWGAVPPTCEVIPAKWQQRLFCATEGEYNLEVHELVADTHAPAEMHALNCCFDLETRVRSLHATRWHLW